jgi:ferredoxin
MATPSDKSQSLRPIINASSSIVRIADTDVSFCCASGQSVLDAAFKAGILLPYSCRKGICALCAGVVTEGEVAAVDALPMVNASCAPEQVLLCRCTPANGCDIVIRPLQWKRGLPPPALR